jgi:hypothetical protein
MERTPLREEFFRRANDDPYLSLVQKFWAEAWVAGYERALRDAITEVAYPRESNEIEEFRHSKSHRERINMALEDLTEDRRQAEEAVSLAMIGTKMERLASDHIARLYKNPQDLMGMI